MSHLRATGIVKRFGGIKALDGAAVDVVPGRITGLIGRNGSGKSTLFNCITGFLKPDEGAVTLDGEDITGLSPDKAAGRGLVRSFQTPRVYPKATVRDAVVCGFFPSTRNSFLGTILGLPGLHREERDLRQRTDHILESFELLHLAETEVGRLSMGIVRLVEVARGMASGARYLLLDEPAAGLSREERTVLCDQVSRLAATGVGVLIVEHNFPLIRSLCDSVTVLDFGSVLASGSPEAVAADWAVIDAYLGSGSDAESGVTA